MNHKKVASHYFSFQWLINKLRVRYLNENLTTYLEKMRKPTFIVPMYITLAKSVQCR